jgi:hypothetical protein
MITITIKLPSSPTVIQDMGQIIHQALVVDGLVYVEKERPVSNGVGELTPDVRTQDSKENKILK